MNRVSSLHALAVAMCGFLIGCSLESSQAEDRSSPRPAHAHSRILVQPRPGLSATDFDRILEAHGGRRVRVIEQINVHVIQLPPGANAAAVADALSRNPDIKFAEADAVVRPELDSSDPK